MAWYWNLLIIFSVIFSFFFPLGFGVYWFNVKKPQLEYDFKTLFGVLHSEERAKIQAAVEEKMRLLTLNWQELVIKFHSEEKKLDEVKKAEEDYRRAEQLAHRFKVEGF